MGRKGVALLLPVVGFSGKVVILLLKGREVCRVENHPKLKETQAWVARSGSSNFLVQLNYTFSLS